MPEIVGVQCPFREGQEEAARQFLAQPLSVPDLRLPSRILRAPYMRWCVTVLVPVNVVAFVGACLITDFEWVSFWHVVFFCIVAPVAIGGLVQLAKWSSGKSVHVCGADAAIYHGRQKLASFDELGVARRVRKTYEVQFDLDPPKTVIRDVIEFARHRQEPLVLFDQELPRVVWEHLDDIADHINAMIAEYHQRKAVRRWLEHHDAHSVPSRGYR